MRGQGAAVTELSLLVLLILASVSPAFAATVRGRLDRAAAQGLYPAINVPVTLYSKPTGRSRPTYTDSRGFFYFYDIRPGNYTVEIWVSREPLVRRLYVTNQPYADIPPVRVR